MKYRLLLLITFVVFAVPTSVNAQAPRYARVISENANLRDTPAINSTTTQEIAEDTLVKVLDEKLPWYVVRVGNRVGWMHGDTLQFINADASTQSQESVTPTPPSVTPNSPGISSGPAPRATPRVEPAPPSA